MSIAVIAPHCVKHSSTHYANVRAYMQAHGAPTIRAWWSGDEGAWIAIEGSHRLAAAHALGVEPVIEDVGASDEERAEALRSSDIDDGDLYGRKWDDDADLVAWWASDRRVMESVRYEW